MVATPKQQLSKTSKETRPKWEMFASNAPTCLEDGKHITPLTRGSGVHGVAAQSIGPDARCQESGAQVNSVSSGPQMRSTAGMEDELASFGSSLDTTDQSARSTHR